MPDNIEPVFGGSGPAANAGNTGTPNNADNSSNDGSLAPNQGFAGGQGNDNSNLNPSNDFLTSLSEENRRLVQAKNWNTPDDVVRGYAASESRMSQGLQLKPEGEDGQFTPEQWDQFGRKVGAPEKADYYQFDRPDVPDYVAYDEGMENGFRETVHKYKLTKAQAAGVYADMSKMMVGQQQSGYEGVRQNMAKANEMISTEYGGSDSPMYRDSVQMAFESIKNTPGLLEAYQRAGLLVPAGDGKYHVTDASIVFAHANAGSAMLTEGQGFNRMDGSTAGSNPFDPNNENLGAQGKIINEDPRRAASLIRQAGLNPAEYGITV